MIGEGVEAGKTQFIYEDLAATSTDAFLIDESCDCILIYEVDILARYSNPYVRLDDIINNYGEPEAVTRPEYEYRRSANFIFATIGVMVVAQRDQKPEENIVFAARYFEQMSLEEYMELWGARHNTDLYHHSPWKAYQYTP